MRNLSRRNTLLGLVALAPTAGCYGSFKLTKKVYDFNGSFSNIVLKEVVFLAFIILPVYGLAMLVDAIILNLIEFATGSNPVSGKSLGDGHEVAFERLPDGKTIRVTHTRHGAVEKTFLVRRKGEGFELLDPGQETLASVQPTVDGGALVLDGRGSLLHDVDPATLEQIQSELEHRPLHALVTEAVRSPVVQRRTAQRRAGATF
jgi:hypothetical protein